MRKPCHECPFVKASPLIGAPDWLEDIVASLKLGHEFQHSCHKTDPSADGYVGGKKQECMGHLTMMMNEIDATPGLGGVYESRLKLVETYLEHWLGKERLEQMRVEFVERRQA